MSEARNAECVIVGAGGIGSAIAWRLAQEGLRPLVIDVGQPGEEASQAAAGILGPQTEADGPGPVLDLGLASLARFPAFVAELEGETGIHVGYRPSGVLMLAEAEDEGALEHRFEWQRALGLSVEKLTPEQVSLLEPELGRYQQALHFPTEAQVEPPRLVRALALAAQKRGATFSRSRVCGIEHAGGAVSGVRVLDVFGEHTIAARQVVVAAGSWSSLLDGSMMPSGAVRPMRGQAVEVDAGALPLRHVMFGRGAYLVPRADGRVYIGATMEDVGYHKTVTVDAVAALLSAARDMVPALGRAHVERFWVGLRPFAGDHRPYLGATPLGGLFLATGHFRNGILHCPITAEALAACVMGRPAPLDLGPFSLAR